MLAMTNHNKAWRRSEETKLVERVNELLKTDDWDAAFEQVGLELGRTERGCKDRWNMLNGKRKRRLVKPEMPKNDYAQLYNNFKSVSGELENVIGNLMGENERLKRRVTELEKMEAKFMELANYFKRSDNHEL